VRRPKARFGPTAPRPALAFQKKRKVHEVAEQETSSHFFRLLKRSMQVVSLAITREMAWCELEKKDLMSQTQQLRVSTFQFVSSPTRFRLANPQAA
jgi:hypothetical protein